MRTNIDLDDALVEEALRSTGVSTKKELVHLALRELIANRRRLDVRELPGTVGIRPDYDHKKLRNEET
ncbi:type II toxin-antitoxin system VapB family antitoxin [bacterium]|nr:MAG: type II toxin-antitoxin system VapB family antitoxin [bacterium]